MRYRKLLLLVLLLSMASAHGQKKSFNFRIRTITAGVTLKSLSDTATINRAVVFLRKAEKEFTDAGYEVQTLRIATSNLYTYLNGRSLNEALPFLKTFDDIAVRNDIALLSIGQVLPPQKYQDGIGEWAATVAKNTKKISFNLSISSHQ